ncbi:hypothetical protein [Actinomadura violacea]|uniref:Uncharacterized protein n=1 Tax=Actinomadura violacea TaxID=2819934 RepID=A0ABS3RXD6_9ACTN|nr:hypothetical protein [Actinomadura violacea]MBO2461426.1 hypothetical protein [Actinomadura violacea]
MALYEEWEDRKILRVRGARVVEVRAAPAFFLRLTGGLVLEFGGPVLHTLGPRGEGSAAPRSLGEFSDEELAGLVGASPLSWVVFDGGDQRIVFSNSWHLTLEAEAGDSWSLELGDGSRLLE